MSGFFLMTKNYYLDSLRNHRIQSNMCISIEDLSINEDGVLSAVSLVVIPKCT